MNDNIHSSQSLENLYNSLKSSQETNDTDIEPINIGNMSIRDDNHRKMIINRRARDVEELANRKLMLKMYASILPLDKKHIDNNPQMVSNDIDNFLGSKDQTATQYLTSAYNNTNASLLEYMLNCTKEIKAEFVESALYERDDENALGIDTDENDIDADADKIDEQLVDIEKDDEYGDFIEKLKAKTVDRIVKDISDVIVQKKSENDMQFKIDDPTGDDESDNDTDDGLVDDDTNDTDSDSNSDMSDESNESEPDSGNNPPDDTDNEPSSDTDDDDDPSNDTQTMGESIVYNGMKYINKQISLMESIGDYDDDDVIGVCIRESTLNEFDRVFAFTHSNIDHINRIKYRKSYLIESFVESLKNNC